MPQSEYDTSRVLCSESNEYDKVRQLIQLGLALPAIAAMTGLSEGEVARINATNTVRF